jgi:hypothetical protein
MAKSLAISKLTLCIIGCIVFVSLAYLVYRGFTVYNPRQEEEPFSNSNCQLTGKYTQFNIKNELNSGSVILYTNCFPHNSKTADVMVLRRGSRYTILDKKWAYIEIKKDAYADDEYGPSLQFYLGGSKMPFSAGFFGNNGEKYDSTRKVTFICVKDFAPKLAGNASVTVNSFNISLPKNGSFDGCTIPAPSADDDDDIPPKLSAETMDFAKQLLDQTTINAAGNVDVQALKGNAAKLMMHKLNAKVDQKLAASTDTSMKQKIKQKFTKFLMKKLNEKVDQKFGGKSQEGQLLLKDNYTKTNAFQNLAGKAGLEGVDEEDILNAGKTGKDLYDQARSGNMDMDQETMAKAGQAGTFLMDAYKNRKGGSADGGQVQSGSPSGKGQQCYCYC